MRLAATWLLAASAILAQAPPLAIVRGNLLEWESRNGAGELSIRTAANQVFRFAFDAKTYFERESESTSISKLQKGDFVEIVSDKAPEISLRYARTIHVVDRQPPRRRAPESLGRYRAYRSIFDRITPLGDLTFSGIVARLDDGRMVLRTRTGGDKTIVLREDTRYLAGGLQVEPADLKPNMRVFVRGSKNIDDEVEAYQVVWGEILEPRR
jgi:hypothetical protein